ncbi:hypothetical protein SAMN02927924_01694 [Sphingobium faniae]|nr:hypothetical protein SAMN02927924_01694 [Sphingobium faniae]
MTSHTLATIMSVYTGSDGDQTKALYDALDAFGPAGAVAINLFRACKASERAKAYRGGIRGKGSFRRMAYDRKGWAIDNLTKALTAHGEAIGVRWGWGEDRATAGYAHVLYVDTPAGQVSFHSPCRGEGPDYPDEWDGIRGQAAQRICRFVAQVLGAA